MRIRFDPDLLDADDPFEIDEGNRAHLYKHLPIGHEKRVAVGVEDILTFTTTAILCMTPRRRAELRTG